MCFGLYIPIWSRAFFSFYILTLVVHGLVPFSSFLCVCLALQRIGTKCEEKTWMQKKIDNTGVSRRRSLELPVSHPTVVIPKWPTNFTLSNAMTS